MAAFAFAFITFAMLASQSASTRSREDHVMLMTPQEEKKWAKSFLELHQQFMFAPISHPHHGKNGNKGIAAFFFDFSMLFFVTSKPKVTAAKRQVQRKKKVPKFASNMLETLHGRLTSDTFVCGRIRAMALHPKERWRLYSKNSPGGQTICQVFWSCTCHACFNFPHTFVGIAMGKFRTQGLLFFSFFMLFDVQGLCNVSADLQECTTLSRKVEKYGLHLFACEWGTRKGIPGCYPFKKSKRRRK